MEKVMITRQPAMVEYAREIGLIDESTRVIERATVADVQGMDVIGALPLSLESLEQGAYVGVIPMFLAAYAESVTEIPLSLTPEDQGELSIERIRKIAAEPRTYEVRALMRPKRKRMRFSEGQLQVLLGQG